MLFRMEYTPTSQEYWNRAKEDDLIEQTSKQGLYIYQEKKKKNNILQLHHPPQP